MQRKKMMMHPKTAGVECFLMSTNKQIFALQAVRLGKSLLHEVWCFFNHGWVSFLSIVVWCTHLHLLNHGKIEKKWGNVCMINKWYACVRDVFMWIKLWLIRVFLSSVERHGEPMKAVSSRHMRERSMLVIPLHFFVSCSLFTCQEITWGVYSAGEFWKISLHWKKVELLDVCAACWESSCFFLWLCDEAQLSRLLMLNVNMYHISAVTLWVFNMKLQVPLKSFLPNKSLLTCACTGYSLSTCRLNNWQTLIQKAVPHLFSAFL